MRRLLTSWKDVAAYLGKTSRTAQRWERDLGLPIHRPLNKPTGVILADSDEIDAWISARRMHSSTGTTPVLLTDISNPESLRSAQPIAPAYARVLESIARRDSCSETLDLLVRAIEQDLKCVFASILLLDAERKHLVHVAGPNVPVTFKRIIDGMKIGSKEGSFGTAVLKRETVIVENILVDEKWVKFRQFANEYGFAACWATPIVSSADKVMGMFDVYYATPHSPSRSDLKAMELAGHLAAITLELNNIEKIESKPKSNLPFLALNRQLNITFVNREMARLFDCSPEEMLGKNLWDLYPEFVGSIYHSEYERALRENVTVVFETFSTRFSVRVLVTAHPHESGLTVFLRTLPQSDLVSG
jgi:PAS domain-containing protein